MAGAYFSMSCLNFFMSASEKSLECRQTVHNPRHMGLNRHICCGTHSAPNRFTGGNNSRVTVDQHDAARPVVFEPGAARRRGDEAGEDGEAEGVGELQLHLDEAGGG